MPAWLAPTQNCGVDPKQEQWVEGGRKRPVQPEARRADWAAIWPHTVNKLNYHRSRGVRYAYGKYMLPLGLGAVPGADYCVKSSCTIRYARNELSMVTTWDHGKSLQRRRAPYRTCRRGARAARDQEHGSCRGGLSSGTEPLSSSCHRPDTIRASKYRAQCHSLPRSHLPQTANAPLPARSAKRAYWYTAATPLRAHASPRRLNSFLRAAAAPTPATRPEQSPKACTYRRPCPMQHSSHHHLQPLPLPCLRA